MSANGSGASRDARRAEFGRRLRASGDRVKGMVEDVGRLAAGAEEMRRRLNELRVTVRSDDGYVTATTDAQGRLVDIRIDARVFRTPDAEALADQIRETIEAAADQSAVEVDGIVRSYVPAELMPPPLIEALSPGDRHGRRR